LNEDKLKELLEKLSPQQRLLFAIGYYTSFRLSEALKLKRSDLIGDRTIIGTVTKKKKQTREVKIPARLAAILTGSDVPGSGYISPDVRGGHLSRQAVDLALRKACNYIGFLGISTDSFIPTSRTKLYDARRPLRRKHAAHWIPQLGKLCQVL
jgi:integrase/recombinase XerD